MKKKKSKRGRPPKSEHAATAVVQIRVPPLLKHLWRVAAEMEGKTLTEYILDAINEHKIKPIKKK